MSHFRSAVPRSAVDSGALLGWNGYGAPKANTRSVRPTA